MKRGSIVSVAVPAYNAGEYLRPAVESILRQTYIDLELLVVDDGSTDASMDSIRSISDARLRIIEQRNSGKAEAMNRVLDVGRGEFLAIQDADDLSYPERIERQLRHLQQNDELAAVFCGHDLIVRGRRMAPRLRAKSDSECAVDVTSFRPPAHDAAVMYRRSAIGDERFEPSLRIGQGVDFALRIGEQHPVEMIGECLYSYRIHDASSVHSSVERRAAASVLVVERACARRGLGPDETGRAIRNCLTRARAMDNNLYATFLESVIDQRRAGRWLGAATSAWQSICLSPLRYDYYKPLLSLMTPPLVHQQWRRIKGLVSNRSGLVQMQSRGMAS